jgi:tetratricopeptide (TPR) repeat protein
LYDGSAEAVILASAAVEGPPGELLTLVDDLAENLLGALIEEAGESVASTASQTTKSYAALKAFLLGESHARAGSFQLAVKAYEEAVVEDPEFALAWYRMGMFTGMTPGGEGLTPRAVAMAKTHELKDRLPARYQRYLEVGDARLKDAEEAIRLATTLLRRYPDDVWLWEDLANYYFESGRKQGIYLPEAREAFNRVLDLDPESYTAKLFICWIDSLEEKYEACIACYQELVEQAGGGDRTWVTADWVDLVSGDSASKRALIENGKGDDWHIHSIGATVQYVGDFEGAHLLAERRSDPSRPEFERAWALWYLAMMDLARGRWSEAKDHLAELDPIPKGEAASLRAQLILHPLLDPPRAELKALREEISGLEEAKIKPGVNAKSYFLGLLSARLGDAASALEHAAELDRIKEDLEAEKRSIEAKGEDQPSRRLMRRLLLTRDMGHSVRAEEALARGDTAAALAEMEQFHPKELFEHIGVNNEPLIEELYERYQRASLLEAVGRNQEALRWYRSLGQASWFDVLYLAPKHLRMGGIYERTGDPQEAIRHYERFVELWKDCDPELRHHVHDVENRLERLRREA